MLKFGGNSLHRRLLSVTLTFLLLGVIVPMQIGLVRAEAFTDPTGDLFDKEGEQVSAEPYLDIVEVELTQSGAEYNARIRVNGPLPSSLTDPSLFLEWDLLVDIDQNRETHPWSWTLLDNGIGVDLLIRLMLGPSGSAYRAQVWNAATKKGVSISFNIDGAALQLKFDDSSLGTIPKAFDFVFAARKYGDYARAGAAMLAADNAPNRGYFTFSDGKTSLAAEFIVRQPYQGPMTDAHAHAFGTSRWIVDAFESYHRAGVDKVIFFGGDSALEAHRSRPDWIVPSFGIVRYMNRTGSLEDVERALKSGFPWIGEATLRHCLSGPGAFTNTPADDPIALQIYDLCAKYQAPITIHQDDSSSSEYIGAYEELERAFAHSPNCIFVFHGWWPGEGHLSFKKMEEIIINYPNVYIELAGRLETSGSSGSERFLGETSQDTLAYPDGKIRGDWRRLFEKYPERFINGFDLNSPPVFTFEEIKIRVDYFRKLFGQIDQAAAEMINYKNVEDLLARRVCLMNVSLSSESVKVGDPLTITARLRNMGGNPLGNETVAFFLEGSDGKTVSLGEAKTDKAGLAVLSYAVNVGGGSYWVVVSHPESSSYAYRSARNKLIVNQPITTASISTISATTTESQKKCIIATAAYGSELAPEFQFLRTFRDDVVMSTQSGRAFMNVFNNWYYSFSPQVANVISESQLLRNTAKASLYPLIGALWISASLQSVLAFNPELATVMAGLVASTLIGLVYLSAPMLLISMLLPWRWRSRRKI